MAVKSFATLLATIDSFDRIVTDVIPQWTKDWHLNVALPFDALDVSAHIEIGVNKKISWNTDVFKTLTNALAFNESPANDLRMLTRAVREANEFHFVGALNYFDSFTRRLKSYGDLTIGNV